MANDPMTTKLQGDRISLQSQLLKEMATRHMLWSKSASHPEIASLHIQLATSIMSLVAEYDSILASSQSDNT